MSKSTTSNLIMKTKKHKSLIIFQFAREIDVVKQIIINVCKQEGYTQIPPRESFEKEKKNVTQKTN